MEDYRYENGTAVKYRHTEYTYDGLNRLKTFAEMNTSLEAPDTANYRITYTYDFNDNIIEISYGSALGSEVDKVKYSYTNNQLMSLSVTIGSTDYLVKAYTYNQDGTTASVKDYYNFKSGTSDYLYLTYTYDALGRIAEMTYTNEDGTVVESHTYEYDKNSNITRETELNLLNEENGTHYARVYAYDYAGQLIQSDISSITTTTREVETGEYDENGVAETVTETVTTENPYLTTVYTYDAVGNRVSKVETDENSAVTTTTYTYNELNQLVTEAGTETLTYDYDSNGNQVSITGGETSRYFTYTPSGMLATYTSGSDSQVNLYNGNGQRVQKTEGSDETNYFYQNDSILYTTDADGSLKSFNLLNVSDAFATSRMDGTTESYYFYTEDQRGSTVNVLDSTGSQVVSYWYTDFGEVEATKAEGYSNFINEIQYTGGIYDELTGLLYLNARFYDPTTGRFITQDTYRGERNNADTWHLYAYCANNPINYVDPSGHFIVTRNMVSIPVDILLSVTGIGLAFNPLKVVAKRCVRKACKVNEVIYAYRTFFRKFSKVSKKIGYKASKAIKKSKLIKNSKIKSKVANFVGKVFTESINSIAMYLATNKVMSEMLGNLDIFMSPGGLLSGILDVDYDGKLNNVVYRF